MNNNNSQLESTMVTYTQLLSIPVKENNEPMVIVDQQDIPNGYLEGMADMEKFLGKTILVRQTVLNKLKLAQKILQNEYPYYSLFLTYGYRTLEIQTKRFLERLKSFSSIYYPDPRDFYEAVHRSISVPCVAGHPTGGAIDITIIDIRTHKALDFGTKQYDYTNNDFYVFFPNITDLARKNRMLLRNILMQTEFAPFDGEWWHFSYGDREWAKYYKIPFALYEQKGLNAIEILKMI